MTKYIIEIPDDVQYVLFSGKADNKYYTAVSPIAELEELNSDYINEHFGSLQDEAYQRGLEEGRNVGIKDGMCEAWEAAKKIVCDDSFDWNTLMSIFNSRSFEVIFGNFSASDAVARLRAYEGCKDDHIEVGDEVRTRDGAPSHTFLVTKVTDSHVYGISDDGSWNYWTKDEVTKTGKHYDIASILEAMRTHD
jgi:hypothetical protein